MPPKFFNLALIFLLILLLSTNLFAGISGTISGHVSEGSTGEPLAGVQVIIDGSNRGAVCDASGTFILVNIPPGHYDLRFEMIGYSKQIVTGVPVIIDLQTQIDVEPRYFFEYFKSYPCIENLNHLFISTIN